MNLIWILLTSSMIFMMQPGFALVEAGLGSPRNLANIMLKNLTAIAVSVLVFGCFGFDLMFGAGGILPNVMPGFGGITYPNFVAEPLSTTAITIFHVMFAGTATTIISGAVSGRMTYLVFVGLCIFVSGIVYPLLGRQVWGPGLLAQLGILDFAGGSVVHGIGGACALAAALVCGPRIERMAPSGKLRDIKPANIVFIGLGAFLLWFGWFGFNTGSVLVLSENEALVPKIFLNTFVAGAAGLFAGVCISGIQHRHVQPMIVIDSMLAGLVSITAACAYVSTGSAVVIAVVGAILTAQTSRAVVRLGIDDAVNAFAIHAIPGLWGMTAIALLGTDLKMLRTEQFLIQFFGGLSVVLFASGTSYDFCRLLNLWQSLRVDRDTEVRGLDPALHHFRQRMTIDDVRHDERLRDQGKAIASLSHEIMGSLSAAKVQAELMDMQLEKHPPDDPSTPFFIDRCRQILAGLKRAQKVASLTLAYSRRGTTENEIASLGGAVRAAVDMIGVTHKSSRTTVSVSVNQDIRVRASEVLLIQALYNILKNCCEAFPASQNERGIIVSLNRTGNAACLTIADNAGGMTKELVTIAGDEFVSTKDGHGGLGLGLHLAREYFESIGMELEIAVRKDEGTTFKIVAESGVWQPASKTFHAEHLL